MDSHCVRIYPLLIFQHLLKIGETQLMCSGVCSAVLQSAENKLTWLGKHKPFLALSSLQLTQSQNDRTAGGLQSSLLFRAGLGPVQLTQGSVQLISAISTWMESQNLSGSLFKYLTTPAGFPPCSLGILISISHISSCAHHFPGHPKKNLCVSAAHPPVREL